MKCPVCHSSMVKEDRVFALGRWWSKCISGEDHGVYVLEDGKECEFAQYLWFDTDGWIETPDGLVKVERQEYR